MDCGGNQHLTHRDLAHARRDQYPLLLHFNYFDVYRKQVLMQPGVVLAMTQREDTSISPRSLTKSKAASAVLHLDWWRLGYSAAG